MTKYKIEVEIPDGDFCSGALLHPEINCDYIGDSCASSAGLCSLLKHDDCLLQYEDKHNWQILKHKDCPSRKRSDD